MGVWSQIMGTWDRPVTYLSNQLDNVATGWLGCLQVVAAVALLVWEATKLTLGQDLFIKVLHEVNTFLRGDPHKWLSTSRITQYQGLIWEPPCYYWALSGPESGHSFLWEKVGPHMIARKYASRPDLRDQPILDPVLVLNTTGTSLVKQGQWLLGYAVVLDETIVEASSLPSHWSTQWTELYLLIQALQLSKGKKTNIYTDSRYVCFCHTTGLCIRGGAFDSLWTRY